MTHMAPIAMPDDNARVPFDPILEDLRGFAREVGLRGAGALSKDEIVEGLRQFAVLSALLDGQAASTAPTRASSH